MDIVDHLDGAFASTGRIIATVTPDGLRAPTPCAEWDVRALLNHATGVVAGLGSRPPQRRWRRGHSLAPSKVRAS
jgi:hypothetical protein